MGIRRLALALDDRQMVRWLTDSWHAPDNRLCRVAAKSRGIHHEHNEWGVDMELTITVPDEAKIALEQRARERGCSDVTMYVERLITTDLLAAKSFDEILAPIRRTFQTSGMSEDDVEALFAEAREEVYQEREAKAK